MADYVADHILIVNDGHDCGSPYAPLFQGYSNVTHSIDAFILSPYKFKLIQFTGGADITPALYGDTSPKEICRANNSRDIQEVKVFNKARQAGVKMMGICRGLQFLNVMAGGKMMHHITGHSTEHWISTSHEMKRSSGSFLVNSFHHQMCIPPRGSYILAWSTEKQSATYIGDEDESMNWHGPEIEALFLPTVRAIGVQWHPEVHTTGHQGRIYYRNMIHDYLSMGTTPFRKAYLGEDYVHRTASV